MRLPEGVDGLARLREVVAEPLDSDSVGTGARVMATLCNTVLRLTGHDDIAAALRHHSRNPHRPIDLLHAA